MPAGRSQAQKYGMLVYDVPTKNKTLYLRLWKAIRRRGVRINLSVYLVLWGTRDSLQVIIDEAIDETGQTALVKFLRFHPDETEDIENWAVDCLSRDIRDIVRRLQKRIAKSEEENEDIHPRFFRKLKEDLSNFETLAVMFGFEGNIDGVMETTRKTIERIWRKV